MARPTSHRALRWLVYLILIFMILSLALDATRVDNPTLQGAMIQATTASPTPITSVAPNGATNNVNDWLNQNMPIVVTLGSVGQLLAALLAAIAAWASWAAVKVAQEDASRSRQSFQFASEPLLEVELEVKDTISRGIELALPSARYDPRCAMLPQAAQTVVHDFHNWREQYGDPQYQTVPDPHANMNYLFVNVRNIQINPIGQALDVQILLEFVYADPSQSIQQVIGRNTNTKTELLPFRIGRIGPGDSKSSWIAHIQSVPGIVVSVRAAECRSWGEVLVTRGIGNVVNFSGPHAQSIGDVSLNSRVSVTNIEPIQLRVT